MNCSSFFFLLCCALLQLFTGEFGEAAAFSHNQVDVLKEFLSVEFVTYVGEAVGILVQIRLVYLLNVSGKYNLGSFSRTGDDGLNLVRSKVLRLVNDEESL